MDLPDWTGMDDTSVRITPEAALKLCESYPQWLDAVGMGKAGERPEKCTVEFVL